MSEQCGYFLLWFRVVQITWLTGTLTRRAVSTFSGPSGPVTTEPAGIVCHLNLPSIGLVSRMA